jgi:hypothetical protein
MYERAGQQQTSSQPGGHTASAGEEDVVDAEIVDDERDTKGGVT